MSDSREGETKETETDGIVEPRKADVLCGRGGAALRHTGNQTYRKLVNANKALYITCLKTEKLKISRSIVAAIREQKGRFLERNAKDQTWYDIGDKKAIEKTSQALREGQPKLRQKMIDTGQIAQNTNAGANMDAQYGNGIYSAGSRPPSIGAVSVASVGSMMSSFSMGSLSGPNALQLLLPSSFQGNLDMPPPPSRAMSGDPIAADALIQRLSLTSMAHHHPGSIPSWTPSLASLENENHSMRSARMRMSQQSAGYGRDHAMSGVSDFSGFSSMHDASSVYSGMSGMSGGDQSFGLRNIFTQSGQNMPPIPPPLSPAGNNDRRRLFAKMKMANQGPPSGGNSLRTENSGGDGMPDFHMVDGQFSLVSNLSGHGSSSRHARNSGGVDMMNISGHGMAGLSNLSGHRTMSGSSGHGYPANLGGQESMFAENGGLGSRRSLMSGLSKISDHSTGSMFSDLARKINLPASSMSNRSVAMSEVSGVDEEDDESDDGEFAYDVDPVAYMSDR